jgi:hypothetical protein
VTTRPTLEEARARLRELGYLDAGVDRLLFRAVFLGRGGAFLPAVAIGALAAALAALAAVETAEPGFGGSVPAAVALVLHVLVADLAPAALLAVGLALLADRSRSPGLWATLAGVAAAGLIFLLWIAGTYGLARELPARALLWGIPVAAAALLLAAAVRLAFLARTFARSGALPGRSFRRVFAGAGAVGLVVAILLFSSRREPAAAAPAPLPSPRPVPVVALAVDGLDLDGDTKPPVIVEMLSRGATGWWPAERVAPPEVWTDLATGVSSRRHGVRALARVRPLGCPRALRPPFGTAWYLRRLGPALHLVSSAPVSSGDRRSLDFWEVSASAGIPSLAVGWWASGPWPGATVVENRTIFRGARDGVAADRVAIHLFRDAARNGYGVQTVYLPGCDITRGEPALRRAAVAGVEELLADYVGRASRGELVLAVLAADSHPRSPGALGRMVVFDGATGPRSVRIRPEDVAPSLLARAGVPAARDLAGRPVEALFSPGTLEPATVATYGPRQEAVAAAAPASDREYLEKLRSLGYLQ